jgi:hypothetical protein
MGHYKSDCWAEGGGKAGQGPKGKGKGKNLNADAAATANNDATWMAHVETSILDFVEEGLNTSTALKC